MTIRTKKHLRWIPTLIVAVIMTSSASMKLLHAPMLAAMFERVGLQDQLSLFAFAELAMISLFIWPRTMKIGFYLLTGYYGGALAIEMAVGTTPLLPAMILTLIWIAAFSRNASIFQSVDKQKAAVA